jgi:toxin ParE1/3/4
VRVIWTPEAQQDRADIWDYIAADSPRAAVRMDELFSKAAARLADHPSSAGREEFPALEK